MSVKSLKALQARRSLRTADRRIHTTTAAARAVRVSDQRRVRRSVPHESAAVSAHAAALGCKVARPCLVVLSCRKDAGNQLDYGSASNSRSFNTANGVPVADMTDTYSKETLALYDIILKYGTLDPYDKTRPPLIKELKADSANWVSQYARGGSARKLSARSFYVAVDAVSGHLASNGLAPLPKAKLAKVRANMDEALQYLKDGR